jgi:hypothetical protein
MNANDFYVFALSLLYDDFGISEAAYNNLCELGENLGFTEELERIGNAVKTADGRYYLPDMAEQIGLDNPE